MGSTETIVLCRDLLVCITQCRSELGGINLSISLRLLYQCPGETEETPAAKTQSGRRGEDEGVFVCMSKQVGSAAWHSVLPLWAIIYIRCIIL